MPGLDLQESEEDRQVREERIKQLEVQLNEQDDKLVIARLEDELKISQEGSVRLHAEIDYLQVLIFFLRCIPWSLFKIC